jgi:hypothetical protein
MQFHIPAAALASSLPGDRSSYFGDQPLNRNLARRQHFEATDENPAKKELDHEPRELH